MPTTKETVDFSPPVAMMKGADGSSAAANSSSSVPTGEHQVTDAAVLAYLKEKGLASAVAELKKVLRSSQPEPLSTREELERADDVARSQRTVLAKTTGGGYGYDADGNPTIPQWGIPDTEMEDSSSDKPLAERLGQEEARSYMDSFTALQLWIISLPDDPANLQPNVQPLEKEPKTGVSLSSLVKRAAGDSKIPDKVLQDIESIHESKKAAPWMAPSTKPELLTVSFALCVHTYCELLEVGMESTARALLETFRPIYDPIYPKELADLDKCRTTEAMIRLNAASSHHVEALQALRQLMVKATAYQRQAEELRRDRSFATDANKQRKAAEYDKNVSLLKQKYEEVSKKATSTFEKISELPFLRRARAVRWHISLSTTSYAMLTAFLSSRESLLPMSTLLQTKSEIHVERRDPLPYSPACILDDQVPHKEQPEEVNWAAPLPPAARLAESGETLDHPSKLKESGKLPFPPVQLEEEYESKHEADKGKRQVQFNRALLVNGFRRLEAIERKRDYEAGFRTIPNVKKEEEKSSVALADPLKPTIMLSTLCSSSSAGPFLGSTARVGSVDASAIWEESGIGITCAKMCPPDGRRVAAGCDDASIRIWSLMDSVSQSSDEDGGKGKADGAVSESAMVLLGHKNGFPVFDVNWNRDGRSLLSAGGDGSIRLWDTMAKGPFGEMAKVMRYTAPKSTTLTSKDEGEMKVPGLRAEASSNVSGAGLAVYRGHAPSSPVWAVEQAPSGYYFASAGADATGRIWTTDRPSPVRVLSGHTSASVNTITWHPNCNYVLTGCDDKTVRMWDVQNGRCVRLLSGCMDGVNVVRVCPSGKYAAGADYSGIVHIWDLGNGKKVNELRPDANVGSKRDSAGFQRTSSIIHSMSYSACGTALATGGDDCVVRVWDVRGLANPDYKENSSSAALGLERPGTRSPKKSYATRRTALLDLQYTKRNLLLSVGKYTTAVPLAAPIVD